MAEDEDDRWTSFENHDKNSALGKKGQTEDTPDLADYLRIVLAQKSPRERQERKYKVWFNLNCVKKNSFYQQINSHLFIFTNNVTATSSVRFMRLKPILPPCCLLDQVTKVLQNWGLCPVVTENLDWGIKHQVKQNRLGDY